jgi:deazaflavin-dependent oxidoreductase (nitroreductase family)
VSGRRTAAGLAAVGAVPVALALLWLRGMRHKDSGVVRLQRRLNRDRMNPRVVATAGTPGSRTALVRHTGRSSGRSYETPVDTVAVEDGYLVAMVYGRGTDWVRNVLAGGPAAVVVDGVTREVTGAEVVAVDDVGDALTAGQRRVLRLFAVEEALHLRTR